MALPYLGGPKRPMRSRHGPLHPRFSRGCRMRQPLRPVPKCLTAAVTRRGKTLQHPMGRRPHRAASAAQVKQAQAHGAAHQGQAQAAQVGVAWGVVGDFSTLKPRGHIMKTSNVWMGLALSLALSGAALAQGAGGKPAQGAQAGAPQGLQTKTQLRDPAANPAGVPIRTRDQVHTPAAPATSATR